MQPRKPQSRTQEVEDYEIKSQQQRQTFFVKDCVAVSRIAFECTLTLRFRHTASSRPVMRLRSDKSESGKCGERVTLSECTVVRE
jgi:hypothetical protein